MSDILRFKTYTFPDDDLSFDPVMGNSIPRTQRTPGMDGGYDELGSDAAPLEIGNIKLSFSLVRYPQDTETMQTKRDQIMTMQAWGKQKFFWTPEGMPTRFAFARVNSIRMPMNDKTVFIQPVSIDFQVPDASWYTIGTESWSWGDGTTWGSSPWGGTATPFTVSGLETVRTETIGGTAQTLPRIFIQCGAGQTATNPTIRRYDSSGQLVDEIVWAGTLIAGDILEINCRGKSVRKNGNAAYQANMALDKDWMRLQPGDNLLKFRAANPGDQASVTLKYYEVYR